MSRPFDILVLTHFASPYQVELFDEVARMKPEGFAVYYLHRTHPTRHWAGREPAHQAWFFQDDPACLERARADFASAKLVIFNFYSEPPVPALMAVRVRSGLPWVFWGERPGFKHPWLGRWLRRVKLRALHAGRSPIWGIGRFALDAYRKEFGAAHDYVNLPYFSDLERFRAQAVSLETRPFTFLFSGVLSSRKGTDLLAAAFRQVAFSYPHVRLNIVGSGPLEAVMRRLLAPVRDRVTFVGFVDWQLLPEQYGAAHVVCVPSIHDGWALVVPEALAAGRPVIATERTGAALEFIKEGHNGWLVPAGELQPLVRAMQQAAGLGQEEWHGMSRAASDSVAGHTLANGARRFLDASAAAMGGAR